MRGLRLNEAAIAELEGEGAVGARSLEEFASKLTAPRAAWVMVPAAFAGATVAIAGHFERGDIIIDGGNSYYRDDLDHAAECARAASTSSTSARAAGSSASSAATAS